MNTDVTQLNTIARRKVPLIFGHTEQRDEIRSDPTRLFSTWDHKKNLSSTPGQAELLKLWWWRHLIYYDNGSGLADALKRWLFFSLS